MRVDHLVICCMAVALMAGNTGLPWGLDEEMPEKLAWAMSPSGRGVAFLAGLCTYGQWGSDEWCTPPLSRQGAGGVPERNSWGAFALGRTGPRGRRQVSD